MTQIAGDALALPVGDARFELGDGYPSNDPNLWRSIVARRPPSVPCTSRR